MKINFQKQLARFSLATFSLFCFQVVLFAQETKVEINGNDVGDWFGRNWLWVMVVIVVLLLLVIISGNTRSSRHKTTIFRDNSGEVTRTEVTKSEED